MDVTVRGRNIEVSEQLRAAAEEKVARLGRLLQGMDHAEVHFIEERNPRISEKEVCEVVLAGHGHIVRAKAASSDAFTARRPRRRQARAPAGEAQGQAARPFPSAEARVGKLGESGRGRHRRQQTTQATEDDPDEPRLAHRSSRPSSSPSSP